MKIKYALTSLNRDCFSKYLLTSLIFLPLITYKTIYWTRLRVFINMYYSIQSHHVPNKPTVCLSHAISWTQLEASKCVCASIAIIQVQEIVKIADCEMGIKLLPLGRGQGECAFQQSRDRCSKNYPSMRSSRVWMISSRAWMRSSRVWMISSRAWMRSSRAWMRSSRVWMRSSRAWMRSSWVVWASIRQQSSVQSQ